MQLTELEVLVVDCQATAAGARGHLLEVGWAAVRDGPIAPTARLIRLPAGERVPRGVARITGITDRLLADGIAPADAWAELRAAAAALPQQPAPAVAHFARFERPFLDRLSGGAPTLELVCTHEIARRLLPTLPRRSLRALAGYFGRAVTALRRSAEHVAATAFVWRSLVALLGEAGVETWPQLGAWLKVPVAKGSRSRRGWPMPRELRLALPDRPGLYRMLRTSGDVLYVGKAASLNHRVNSYFRKRKGVHERTLEMLSQARGLSFELTPSALEAALLEPDEIKQHRPPYNVALTDEGRELWFVTPGFGSRSPCPGPRHEIGPFPSGELLEQLSALTRGEAGSLGPGRWGPPAAIFAAGHQQFLQAHPELRDQGRAPHSRLLRLGTRLWREGRRDREQTPGGEAERISAPDWTAPLVLFSLERLVLRAGLALRRARWLTRLVDSSLVWSEQGVAGARLLVVANGELEQRAAVAPGHEPPLPAGHSRSPRERHQGFTIARLDRLRVLTTELKRLVAENEPVALRLGPRACFGGPRLARLLEWL